MTKKKNIRSAGYCIVRPDIVARNERVPIGDGYPLNATNEKKPVLYRWVDDDEGFEVFVDEKWQSAQSIDFDFLDTDKDIVRKRFNGYRDTHAYDEVKGWSKAELSTFLRHCGYRSWTKEINITMVQDLIRIHVFGMKLIPRHNPFLVKKMKFEF